MNKVLFPPIYYSVEKHWIGRIKCFVLDCLRHEFMRVEIADSRKDHRGPYEFHLVNEVQYKTFDWKPEFAVRVRKDAIPPALRWTIAIDLGTDPATLSVTGPPLTHVCVLAMGANKPTYDGQTILPYPGYCGFFLDAPQHLKDLFSDVTCEINYEDLSALLFMTSSLNLKVERYSAAQCVASVYSFLSMFGKKPRFLTSPSTSMRYPYALNICECVVNEHRNCMLIELPSGLYNSSITEASDSIAKPVQAIIPSKQDFDLTIMHYEKWMGRLNLS